MLKRNQTLLGQQLWNCLYKKWNSTGTSSTFLHEPLERIQENIITVLAKMKTGQVAKHVIMLDQKPLSVSDPRKVLKLPFLKVRFCIMLCGERVHLRDSWQNKVGWFLSILNVVH